MYYSVFNAFFFFLHFFKMTSQSFKEFFAIFTSLLWESFEFHKILYLHSLVEVPLWENSNGLTFAIKPQCFTYQKKP